MKYELNEEQMTLVKNFSDARKRLLACIPIDPIFISKDEEYNLEKRSGELEDVAYDLCCSLEKSILES
jgi:hypothetical protein